MDSSKDVRLPAENLMLGVPSVSFIFSITLTIAAY
jgi:hypothetical protein